LHGARFRERGFNQSEDLARAVSEAAGLPLLTGALVRRFPTRSQTELSPEQRAENVARAFQVRDRGAVRGRTIILVDDVFTTGATLDACARQLWECGAEEIKVLAAAVACLR
jgi:ComF family protein